MKILHVWKSIIKHIFCTRFCRVRAWACNKLNGDSLFAWIRPSRLRDGHPTHRRLDRSAVTPAMQVKTRAVTPSPHVMASTLSVKGRRRARQSARKWAGFVAFPGPKDEQPLSRRTPYAPVLTQRVLTSPNDALMLHGFYEEPRDKQTFPLVFLSKK